MLELKRVFQHSTFIKWEIQCKEFSPRIDWSDDMRPSHSLTDDGWPSNMKLGVSLENIVSRSDRKSRSRTFSQYRTVSSIESSISSIVDTEKLWFFLPFFHWKSRILRLKTYIFGTCIFGLLPPLIKEQFVKIIPKKKRVVKKFSQNKKVLSNNSQKNRSFLRPKYRIDIVLYQERKTNIVSISYRMKEKTYRSRVDLLLSFF